MKLVIQTNLFSINSNKLKLNKYKIEYIVYSPKHHVKKARDVHIKVGSGYLNPLCLKDLRLIFGNTLEMEKQVINMCKSSFYHIRNI